MSGVVQLCGCREPHSSSVHRASDETYVYRFFDSADRLLYIGATNDLRTRIKAHQRTKPWWPEVARIEAMPFEFHCQAFEQERVELLERRPVHSRPNAEWSKRAVDHYSRLAVEAREVIA